MQKEPLLRFLSGKFRTHPTHDPQNLQNHITFLIIMILIYMDLSSICEWPRRTLCGWIPPHEATVERILRSSQRRWFQFRADIVSACHAGVCKYLTVELVLLWSFLLVHGMQLCILRCWTCLWWNQLGVVIELAIPSMSPSHQTLGLLFQDSSL